MHWSSVSIRAPHQALLVSSEVAEAIGVSKATLNRWVQEGKFPRPRMINGSPRWTNLAVGLWIAMREYDPEAVDLGTSSLEGSTEPAKGKKKPSGEKLSDS